MVRTLLLLALVGGGLRAQSPDFEMPGRIQDLRAAAQRDSNDPATHYVLALGYWKMELFDQADSQFRLAMRLDADFAPPYVGLFAMTYGRWPALWEGGPKLPADVKRRGDEADRLLRQALTLDPLVDLWPIGTVLPSRGISRAASELFSGHYLTVYSNLGPLVRLMPRDSLPGEALLFHGLAAEHVGLDSEAQADFQALVDQVASIEHANRTVVIPVGAADYDYLLAWVMVRRGQSPAAVKYLHDALVADAGLYEAHTVLAEIAEAGEDWTDAIAERRAAADADPDNSRLLVYLAGTLMNAGRDSEAEAPIRQAVAANPRDFRAQFVLGSVEMHLHKNAEARAAYNAVVALAPSRYRTLADASRRRLAALPQ